MRSAVNSFYKTPLPPFTKAAKKNVKRGGVSHNRIRAERIFTRVGARRRYGRRRAHGPKLLLIYHVAEKIGTPFTLFDAFLHCF